MGAVVPWSRGSRRSSTAAASRSSAWPATGSSSRPTRSPTDTTSSSPRSATAPLADRGSRSRWSRSATTAGVPRSSSTRSAGTSTRVAAWTDHWVTWRTDLVKRLDAGQDVTVDLRIGANLVDGAVRRAAADGATEDAEELERWAARLREGTAARGALDEDLDARMRRHPDRDHVTTFEPALGDRRRPGPCPLLELVRAVPPVNVTEAGPPRHAPRRHRPPRVRAGARLRRPLPAADPPDRDDVPQGPEQRDELRSRRPGRALGDRRAGRRTYGHPSGPRDDRGLRRARRGGQDPWHPGRARYRIPGLARPPVRPRAPDLVPPAPRRHGPVRREPAEEIPGHLPVRLRVRGLAEPVARAVLDLRVLDRPRRRDLPGRQPAHQGIPVLGMGPWRAQACPPGSALPGRGVHPAEGDVPPGQGRVQPVLHVLHVAHPQAGADRVLHGAHATRRCRSSSARTSGRTPRTSSTRRSRPAAGRCSRLAS